MFWILGQLNKTHGLWHRCQLLHIRYQVSSIPSFFFWDAPKLFHCCSIKRFPYSSTTYLQSPLRPIPLNWIAFIRLLSSFYSFVLYWYCLVQLNFFKKLKVKHKNYTHKLRIYFFFSTSGYPSNWGFVFKGGDPTKCIQKRRAGSIG